MNKQQKENVQVKKKKRRGALSTGKKVAIIVILALYVIVLAATSLFVFYRPNTEREDLTAVIVHTDDKGSIVTDEEGNAKTEIVTVQPDEKVDAYNILVLGHDRAAMLTDVFMLVNIDNRDNSITVMQIPRDTYVSDHKGPDGTYHYVATNKINAVFSTYFNYHRYNDGLDVHEAYDKALLSVADILEDNLFINIDYSVIMDLNGFQKIVDILGGVELYVERPMVYDDPEQGLPHGILQSPLQDTRLLTAIRQRAL